MSEDRTVVFRQEIVAASDVKIDPVRCLRCAGQSLVLHGAMSFPHEEVIREGEIIEKKTDWDEAFPFELSAIECLSCQIRFIIKADEVCDLQRAVANLRTLYRQKTGSDPFGGSPPC